MARKQQMKKVVKKGKKVVERKPYKITVNHLKALGAHHAVADFRADFPRGFNVTERNLKKLDQDGTSRFGSYDLLRLVSAKANRAYYRRPFETRHAFIAELLKTAPESAFTKTFLKKLDQIAHRPKDWLEN